MYIICLRDLENYEYAAHKLWWMQCWEEEKNSCRAEKIAWQTSQLNSLHQTIMESKSTKWRQDGHTSHSSVCT